MTETEGSSVAETEGPSGRERLSSFVAEHLFKVGGLATAALIVIRIIFFTRPWSGVEALQVYTRNISTTQLTSLVLFEGAVPAFLIVLAIAGSSFLAPRRGQSTAKFNASLFGLIGIPLSLAGTALILTYQRPLLPIETIVLNEAQPDGGFSFRGFVVEDSGRWMTFIDTDLRVRQIEIDSIELRL